MKLRTRFTIVFAMLVAVILLLYSVVIYYSSEDFRSVQFRERLKDKAQSTIKLLIEVQEVDKPLLEIIDRNTRTLINEFICIFDSKSELLYASYAYRDEIEILNSHISTIANEKEYHFAYHDKEVIGIVYRYENEDFYVFAAGTDTYGIGKITYLKWLLIISFSISIIVIIITGLIFSRQALTPISHVVHEMDQISASNLNIRIKEPVNKDEIFYLARTFNSMLNRIEEAFDLQKNFVRDASHELRTPLTSITSQIDVTLLKERESHEYRDTLISIREDISSINSMVNSLLQLAQSFTDLFRISFTPLRVDEMIFEAQKEIQKAYPAFAVNTEWENTPETEDDFYINGNEQLLRTLMVNILENAYKFSDNKRVGISISFDKSYLKIVFSNTGPTIKPDEYQKVFEPFYRGHNARDRAGSGIGLSLVKRILSFHKGEVSIFVESPNITRVTITLPKISK
jgi:signal transduction histidine kinase